MQICCNAPLNRNILFFNLL